MRRQQHPLTKLIAFASLLSVFGFISCGDPEKPAAGAALDFFITNGNGCGVPSGNWLAPDNQDPFYNSQGLSFSDIRLTRSNVECKVSESGGVYSFRGSFEYKSADTPGTLFFAIAQGIANGPNTPGTAKVSTSHSVDYSGISGDCTLTVRDIAAGGVWADFTCPDSKADNTATSTTCGLNGAFVFDDCDR